ncbi:MAG: NAD(P)-dependent oxidoreductase [Proteobacteria bacterium]|nr:NAD(P)-dependent oxidoreductase [Pseudomonadota bacterium]
MKLGFIGLGAMGRPLAGHLLKAGYALAVWSRRPEGSAPLRAAGARVCASPAEVARHAEIVFTMVTGSEDVATVVLGEEGLIHGSSDGGGLFSTLVDMSTIAPSMARYLAVRLEERGIGMLDAPVSGGVTAAESAALAIMVGGPAETLAQVRPLFDLLGKTIVHVGENGAGQVAKACNQMVMVAAIEACAEAMCLAAASAVDPLKVRLALLGGAAGSRVLEVFGARMVDRDFHAGVEARLHHKDFGILLDEAHRLGCPLPIAAVVRQQLNALMAQGWGRDDSAALLRVVEQESRRK